MSASIGTNTLTDQALAEAEREAERGGPFAVGLVRHLWRVIEARDATIAARDEEIARLRACRAHPGQTAEESELYWHDQAAQLSKMGDDLRVRVAQLEAALRKIETLALPEPSDTAWAYNIARAALEAK